MLSCEMCSFCIHSPVPLLYTHITSSSLLWSGQIISDGKIFVKEIKGRTFVTRTNQQMSERFLRPFCLDDFGISSSHSHRESLFFLFSSICNNNAIWIRGSRVLFLLPVFTFQFSLTCFITFKGEFFFPMGFPP